MIAEFQKRRAKSSVVESHYRIGEDKDQPWHENRGGIVSPTGGRSNLILTALQLIARKIQAKEQTWRCLGFF
jgi:hypothetical protein